MSDGSTVQLQPTGFEAPVDIDHSHGNWLIEYASGRLYFDHGAPKNPTLPYSYVPQSETKPYWSLAKSYSLADRMFQSNTGPTFAAHQYLISGTSQVGPNQFAVDNIFYANAQPVPITDAWGCDDPPGSFMTLLNLAGGERSRRPVSLYR